MFNFPAKVHWMVYQSCSSTTHRRGVMKLVERSTDAAGVYPGVCEVSSVTLAQLEENDSKVETPRTYAMSSNHVEH